MLTVHDASPTGLDGPPKKNLSSATKSSLRVKRVFATINNRGSIMRKDFGTFVKILRSLHNRGNSLDHSRSRSPPPIDKLTRLSDGAIGRGVRNFPRDSPAPLLIHIIIGCVETYDHT